LVVKQDNSSFLPFVLLGPSTVCNPGDQDFPLRKEITVKALSTLFLSILLTLPGAISAQAQSYTESILYNFTLSPAGYDPEPGNLVLDTAGNLYGTTGGGGSCFDNESSCGTVFKLGTDGVFSTLYNFTGEGDGAGPCCLVIDKDGNLYGTTQGVNLNRGTVFKYATKTGKFLTLYQFGRKPDDGLTPSGPLNFGSDGNLYGETIYGGANGEGTLFEMTPEGKETVVYNLESSGHSNFSSPTNVLRDTEGNVFSIVSSCCLFEVNPEGIGTTLADPGNINDYYVILASLVRDAGGNFYGGFAGEEGALYPNGIWEVNGVTFAVSYYGPLSGEPEGPINPLNSDFVGAAFPGGAHNQGYIFKFAPATGVLTDLYDFGADVQDGAAPPGGPIADSAGNLYGTTVSGGLYRQGTVFKLTKNP
jgi:uncharacterized repeat protein (TIGR03803 family)